MIFSCVQISLRLQFCGTDARSFLSPHLLARGKSREIKREKYLAGDFFSASSGCLLLNSLVIYLHHDGSHCRIEILLFKFQRLLDQSMIDRRRTIQRSFFDPRTCGRRNGQMARDCAKLTQHAVLPFRSRLWSVLHLETFLHCLYPLGIILEIF